MNSTLLGEAAAAESEATVGEMIGDEECGRAEETPGLELAAAMGTMSLREWGLKKALGLEEVLRSGGGGVLLLLMGLERRGRGSVMNSVGSSQLVSSFGVWASSTLQLV